MEECIWRRGPSRRKIQQIKNMKKYMFAVRQNLSNAFFYNTYSTEVLCEVFSSFTFDTYKSTISHNGQSVVISFKKDGLPYIICSTGDEYLHFKLMEPPPRVSGNNCDFIFYLNNAADGFSTLQIADGTDRYLSYNENNVAILKKVTDHEREADETIMMDLVDK